MPTVDDVTIVLCTRDRAAQLEGALGAIGRSTSPLVEVVVVDSGSTTSATREVSAAAGVRYLRSDVPGASLARNLGFRSSTREVVVFTDDDCRAEPGWIEALVAWYSDPAVGAVTGRLVDHDRPAPARAATRLTRVTQGLDAGHGALMSFRRELLVRLGGWDEVLGAGRDLGGAEDLDLCCRVLAAGSVVVVEPAAIVRHVNVREGAAYTRLLRGYGLGLGALTTKRLRAAPLPGLGFAAVVLRRAFVRLLRDLRDPRGRRGQAALIAGVATGLARTARTPIEAGRFVDVSPPAAVRLVDSAVTGADDELEAR